MTNLGDLEIFSRVASMGSMSAAGRALGLSPAVISKRIKRLEERLGTRLFQRTTRQISLTEAGLGFHERIEDLAGHICLPPHNNDGWRLEGPDGSLHYRPQGRLVTNSSEVVREAVRSGLGIALRSTWDIGPELRAGRLVQVLEGYEGSRNVLLSAVFPSRQFLPIKVRLFIDYLADLYGPSPYWDV